MLVTCQEMKALELGAFARGVSAEELMDEAGAAIAAAVLQFFSEPGHCVVYFGKGHNGGDALVAARHLARAGWSLELVPAFGRAEWSTLTLAKYEAVELMPSVGRCEYRGRPVAILDGLLGIGAGGALREPVLGATRAINAMRQRTGALVFAIDLPTGIDADTGAADRDAVRADVTLSVGFAKAGLLEDAATGFVGRLVVLPLGELDRQATLDGNTMGGVQVAIPGSLDGLLPRRGFDMHKGQAGRVTILAGSKGFSGAARMAAHGALRAGAGLVTLCVPAEIHGEVAESVQPEIMVKPVESFLEVLALRHDVVGLGPGLGTTRREEIRRLVLELPVPAVVDADALNALDGVPDRVCGGPRLFTPHPGEMQRLEPDSARMARREVVTRFMERHPGHVLLLKGARTLVGESGKGVSYNTTGNPGMATGGMGDVLTGVCAGLAGQGLDLFDAARLGAWICGRAAEISVHRGKQSEESLCATDVLENLGRAIKALRLKGY